MKNLILFSFFSIVILSCQKEQFINQSLNNTINVESNSNSSNNLNSSDSLALIFASDACFIDLFNLIQDEYYLSPKYESLMDPLDRRDFVCNCTSSIEDWNPDNFNTTDEIIDHIYYSTQDSSVTKYYKELDNKFSCFITTNMNIIKQHDSIFIARAVTEAFNELQLNEYNFDQVQLRDPCAQCYSNFANCKNTAGEDFAINSAGTITGSISVGGTIGFFNPGAGVIAGGTTFLAGMLHSGVGFLGDRYQCSNIFNNCLISNNCGSGGNGGEEPMYMKCPD